MDLHLDTSVSLGFVVLLALCETMRARESAETVFILRLAGRPCVRGEAQAISISRKAHQVNAHRYESVAAMKHHWPCHTSEAIAPQTFMPMHRTF